MKTLSVGSLSGLSNTCLHRNWALKRIAERVDEVNTKEKPLSFWGRCAAHLFFLGLPMRLPDNHLENRRIKKMVRCNQYDVVWIDKGLTIRPSTLRNIKKLLPKCKIVSYSPDNMALRHNQSQQYLECLPLYDYVVTNKSYILDDLRDMGAKRVIFVNNTYEPTFHHPYDLTPTDYQDYGADVCFVGAWEEERCKSVMYLADHGIKVRVFGRGKWEKYSQYNPNLTITPKSLDGADYCKALQATKISLCFLRKINFDQQTTRSVEIPACGGFMLAERTDEHQMLFEEGKEAVFFSSNEELLAQCKYYLGHEEERSAIARAGYLRCVESDYSNFGMVRTVLTQIMEEAE